MMPEAPPNPEGAATVAQLHAWGRARLEGDEARRDSELLLAHALRRDRAWLFAHANEDVNASARERFVDAIAQRERGTPVAYLLGAWGFWTLDLRVTPDTLIPRPETELLVETALERLSPNAPLRIADLGTGTGAIALALARERPLAHVIATDASAAALAVARENAARNRISNVEFRLGDWCAPLAGERFDLIASNPPYVAEGDPHLDDLRYEPMLALACGSDGLGALRRIARAAPPHLLPGGWLLLEHGFEQGGAVRALLREAGMVQVETSRDLELRERLSLARTSATGS